MKDSRLNTSIEFIKGIGSIRSKILKEELGLKNCYDLLSFFPYKYLDRSRFYKIKEIDSSNIYVQIIGVFTNLSYKKSGNKYRIEAVFFDGERSVKILWFKGLKWVEKSIKMNFKYVALNSYNNKVNYDVIVGKHRKINLLIEPFNLNQPLEYFKDYEDDKFIFLYDKKNFIQNLVAGSGIEPLTSGL